MNTYFFADKERTVVKMLMPARLQDYQSSVHTIDSHRSEGQLYRMPVEAMARALEADYEPISPEEFKSLSRTFLSEQMNYFGYKAEQARQTPRTAVFTQSYA